VKKNILPYLQWTNCRSHPIEIEVMKNKERKSLFAGALLEAAKDFAKEMGEKPGDRNGGGQQVQSKVIDIRTIELIKSRKIHYLKIPHCCNS
jgi:hypothetical protein